MGGGSTFCLFQMTRNERKRDYLASKMFRTCTLQQVRLHCMSLHKEKNFDKSKADKGLKFYNKNVDGELELLKDFERFTDCHMIGVKM